MSGDGGEADGRGELLLLLLLRGLAGGGGRMQGRRALLILLLLLLILLLTLAELALGGLVVLWQVPLATALLHQALGVATFGAISLLMWRANAPVSDPKAVHARSLSRA